MTSNALEKLFGSPARVKILRLFLLNPETFFDTKEISRRAKVSISSARREILLLKSINFILEKSTKIDKLINLRNGKIKNKKQSIRGLILNQSFVFLPPLRVLLVNYAPVSTADILKKISRAGKIKLLVLAGIFIQSENSRVDIMVVGDSLKTRVIENHLKQMEAEIGKELSYAVMTTQDFLYRISMYDRFVRDVLDYPHEKVINKLNLE